MNITVNGQQRLLAEPTTVATLLAEMGLAEKRVAVEVNNAIVPRSRHSEHQLADADIVEVVNAIGGG